MRLNRRDVWIILLVLVPYLALNAFYPNTMMAEQTVRFMVFLIGFVLLPSVVFAALYMKQAPVDASIKVLLSTPVAMFALFLLSIAGSYTAMRWLPLLSVVASLAGMAWLFSRGTGKVESPAPDASVSRNLLYVLGAITGIAVLLLFKYTILPATLPTEQHEGVYFHDPLWVIGNSWSYARNGLPLVDPRFSDGFIYYHMVQSIFEGELFRMLHVDPFFAHLYFDSIFLVILSVVALIYGSHLFLKFSPLHAALFAVAFLFTNELYFNRAQYQAGIFLGPESFLFGLPSLTLLLLGTAGYVSGRTTYRANVLYFASLMGLLFASKSFFLAIVPVSLLITLLLVKRFNLKKLNRFEIALGVGTALVVALLIKTIYHNPEPVTDTAVQFVKPDESSRINRMMIDHGIGFMMGPVNFVKTFILTVADTIVNWYSLFIAAALVMLVRTRDPELRNIFLFFGSLVTITFILFKCVIDLGFDSYYVNFYTVLLLNILGFICYRELTLSRAKFRVAASALFGLCLSIGIFRFYSNVQASATADFGALPQNRHQFAHNPRTIDHFEWEGLQWLKNNTTQDITYFSDRSDYPSPYESRSKYIWFFTYAAMSGRQPIVEGTKREVFTPENKALKRTELLRQINIFRFSGDQYAQLAALKKINSDYFLHCKRLYSKSYETLTGSTLTNVFENPSIAIYKIIR